MRKRVAWIPAALACAIALGGAAALAEGTASAPDSPVADGPTPNAKPERPGYEAVGPSERRGRATDLEDSEVESGDPLPASGDGEAISGDTHALDDLARPPGPARKKNAWELEGIPGPLKLRRLPSEAPPPDAPLLVRLCDAEDTRTFAQRERKDAVRAYKRARRGEYPRGRDKWLVVTRRDIAIRRAERADSEWDALLAEASTEHVDFDAADCP